ncbi:HutD/Ves family protein [Caproicibacterium sp. NSD3]
MEPLIRHIFPSDFVVSNWSGGTTSQIAIGPQNTQYAERDFLWRLSTATVNVQESDFTMLPDYSRYISLLKGKIHLSHDGGKVLSLSPYEIHAFDGGSTTHSEGTCVDFNLMLRKGACKGNLFCLHLAESTEMTIPASPCTNDYRHTTIVYATKGSGTLSAGTTSQVFFCKEAVMVSGFSAPLLLKSRESSIFMIAEIDTLLSAPI